MIDAQEQQLPRLVPELTPELLAQSNEDQAKWRARVRIPDFLQDRQLARTFLRKTELAELIQVVDQLSTSDTERRRFFCEQIAEIYAANGQFTEAVVYSEAGTPKCELYLAYRRAEELDDAAECEHYRGVFINAGQKVEQIYVERNNVPSEKYSEPVPILRCNVCGHRNMRPFRAGERERFM